MNIKKNILITLMVTWTALSLSAGQLNISTGYNGYYSDNIFLNASGIKDYVSQFQADLGFSFHKFNIYLDTSVDIYNQNPDFNSFYLEPGIEFLQTLKGRSAVYVNLGFAALQYRELFTDFNYSGPMLQTGIKLYLGKQTLFRAGYYFQSRNYNNFESFDFFNHTAFLELNRFFDSQTTIRVQTGFNYRYYPHILLEEANQSNNSQNPGKGNNPGNNQTVPLYGDSKVPNFYSTIRISQGLGARLGLSGEAEFRHNFRGLDDTGALVANAYVIYPYNDNYLWDGTRLSVNVKLILFKEIALEGIFSYFNKGYPGIYVMAETGDPVQPLVDRRDKMYQYRLGLSKKFKKMDLNFSFIYRDNNSNDPYFLYSMLTFSMGIGYYF